MKNYFTNPLVYLFAGIGLNRGMALSPLYSALIGSRQSIQLFSAKGHKDFPNAFANDDGVVEKRLKKRSIKSFQPKTANQQAFVDLMRNDTVDIIIAIGPAGTGKTMLACYSAIEALLQGKVNKVVVTRPVVSVDEELGFLPGGLESKMDPWTRPIFDTFRETYSAKELDKMTEDGVIEIVPLGFMRGRTFKNAWIIADEMQNSSPTQMFMLATRIGEGSKMIITGDLNQSDLNPKSNGLLEIYGKIRGFERSGELDCVRYVELDREDVQRSRAAKTVLNIYDPIVPVSCSVNDKTCGEPLPLNIGFTVESEIFGREGASNDNANNAGHKVVGVRGFAGEISGAQRMESCKSNKPLEYSAYEDDAQLTNEFEYLNQVVSSGINVEDQQISGSSPDCSNPSPDCSNPPKDWVNIDNDAALIPVHHISKHYNNLYKR